MGKQLDGVADRMKELHEKNKSALEMKQKQVDECEAEINRIKRMMQ